MDIEDIKNALLNNNKEKTTYNKNFLKKLLLSKCDNTMMNPTSSSSINYLVSDIISSEDLSQEEKNNLLKVFRKEMDDKLESSRNFLNSLFGECPCKEQHKEASVEDEDDSEEVNDDNSTDNE